MAIRQAVIVGFSPSLLRRSVWARSFFPSILYIYYPFPFNPFSICSLVLCTRFAQVLCFVVLMQRSFTIHEMDSASEPPSPMAAAPSDKRKFWTCLHCPSRMPSIDFDSHTVCIKCRNQVCDLDVHCDECRDWPVSKRKVFVKYNHGLKARCDSKRNCKARLSGAAQSSDQSVYDTDTDVPYLDEPSVPVQSVDLDCVISQDCVVSESGGLSEAGPSEVLYVSSGDSLEKLASSIFSKISELQSDRGWPPPPPVQSYSIVGSSSRPIVADTEFLGVSAPPQGVYLSNPVNPVFRLPTAPVSDETPHHRLVASDRRVQELEQAVSATRQAISTLCDGGVRPPFHSPRRLDDLLRSAGCVAYLQVPIHPESRRYLRFTMGGVPYQFRVLCFGLTTAPQVFTRLMAPISAILHHYGIRMLRYLDDWLILAESRTACIQARDRLLQVC